MSRFESLTDVDVDVVVVFGADLSGLFEMIAAAAEDDNTIDLICFADDDVVVEDDDLDEFR